MECEICQSPELYHCDCPNGPTRTFKVKPQTIAEFKAPRKGIDYTFLAVSAVVIIMLLLMLTGCAESSGDQPVQFQSAAAQPDTGAPVPRDPAVALSNKLIGQIQRLEVGAAELVLNCPDGACGPLPEARLECWRGTSQVRSDESPQWCRLLP
jgi:hypothetical protein